MTTNRKTLIAAALAGIGASVCCIGPLLLLTLGVSGTWIGSLTAMEPYSSYLSGLTVLILIVVFRKLYLIPQKCEDGSVCEDKSMQKRQKIIFWIVAIVLLAMITFPYYAEYIIS
jgi:mercuric ion transport protein